MIKLSKISSVVCDWLNFEGDRNNTFPLTAFGWRHRCHLIHLPAEMTQLEFFIWTWEVRVRGMETIGYLLSSESKTLSNTVKLGPNNWHCGKNSQDFLWQSTGNWMRQCWPWDTLIYLQKDSDRRESKAQKTDSQTIHPFLELLMLFDSK